MAQANGAARAASTFNPSPGEAEVTADLLKLGVATYREQANGAIGATAIARIGDRSEAALRGLAGDAP